jgi:hypothetical protein
MASAVPIELFEPIVWFENQVKRVTLKPPTGFHAAQFGEPRFLIRMVDGSTYWVEKDEVIASYLNVLLSLNGTDPVDGGANAMLRLMSLADFLQVREALLNFFSAAREMIFERSVARSPSASASSPPPNSTT